MCHHPRGYVSNARGWTHVCSHTALLGGSEPLIISAQDACLWDVMGQQEHGDRVVSIL